MENKHLQKYAKDNLRACQLKQLDILERVAQICDKHHIEYWLDGGTLLGAVRHGGFIPWDDDIDIAMSMDDLKKFIKIAPKELPDNLFLQTPETEPKAKEPIIKIRDLNSLYIEPGDTFNVEYQKGIYIDIFPFVDYPSIPRSWVKILCQNISKSNSILHKQHYYSLRSFAEFFYFGFKLLLCNFIWKLLTLVSKKDSFTSTITTNNGEGIMHRKQCIYPLSQIKFEGKTFSAPHDHDEFLKDLYANYMEIPPVEQRKVHAVYINPEFK